jgi:transposase
VSESKAVLTEPKLERRTRRRFSTTEKRRLLAETDALPHGEQGASLRRNGLNAALLSERRKALA